MATTIAAIATPHAAGGISVIRISGEQAFSVADRVFRSVSGKQAETMPGYTCTFGRVMQQDGTDLDDAVLTVFRAPHSYTGEDTAELSCHGGIYVTREVLRAVLEAGAEPAEPGEFTRRAFLNGKMTLTQAEAVMDVISAAGKRELAFARSQQEGAVFRRIRQITEKIVQILGSLAAWADYPEEDIPAVSPENLQHSIREVQQDLQSALDTADYGRILREGVSAVIAGQPNVGKSTLFNLLSGCERSIVTNIAGTTRDVVEESIRLGNVTLRLSDTAGLHETGDVIEQIGVQIARERLQQADLVLAVFDASNPISEEDLQNFNLLLQGKKTIAILNKLDLEGGMCAEQLGTYFDTVIPMSAKEGTGLEQLQACVEEMFYNAELTPEMGLLSTERQVHCVRQAKTQIDLALEALEAGEMLDAITVLLDEAAQQLMLLTGERVTEAVVEDVFSRFCVGK